MEASRRIGRWSARYTLSRSSVLLCDCETVAQQAVSLGMKRDRIVVFPWGVDLDLFSPGEDLGLLDELGWTGKFVLLSTRSWEPIYGPEVLIQGFIQAAEKHPDLRMIMMGGGSLEGRIKDALQQAGLSDRVFFAGSVANDQLPDYYRAADLYVSASFSDGSSVSLLEAMACGTPALVSDIPANREGVERGKSGWWFRCGDALSLAEKVKQIRSKTDQLATVGKRARQLAEERANWEINFRKLLGAYQVALEREGISL
jgi:glycosyltransferase involved in cell wall biosynthesis